MIRAAIYARFSSDLQRDRSIDDQIALCRAYADRQGFTVVAEFSDRALSGASMATRPGFLSLMRAAEARGFDVLLAEDVDRLARDQGDWHNARKRIEFLGIEIHTAHGHVTRLEGSMRALMSEMFLDNLRGHIRRGMMGVVRDGRHAGGRAYGYRPVPGKRGELAIDAAEAAIVRRIFGCYVAGDSPRAIAAALNAEGVPPPRGRYWTASTINGNAKRGHGLLQNDIYAGRIVWNRVRMIRDPDTGKRVSRPNPREEWQTAEAPPLRIVDDEVWEAAQARRKARTFVPAPRKRPMRYLLQGLLRCGLCGGSITVRDRRMSGGRRRTRMQCVTARETGTCANRRIYWLDTIESAVIGGLRERLVEPKSMALFVRAYEAERRRLASGGARRRARAQSDLTSAQARLDRAIDAYLDGVLERAEAAKRVAIARAERDAAGAALAAIDAPAKVVSLHPGAISRYLTEIERLRPLLAAGADGDATEASAVLRELIQAVTIAPGDSAGASIEVRGRLAALLDAPLYPAMAIAGGSCVVAEVRFTPDPPDDFGPIFVFRAA